MAKKLEVKNLIISFRTNNGTVKAVRDISFDLEKGETLAIVGESGSGKSVTARAIMGILAKNAIPEGGEIKLTNPTERALCMVLSQYEERVRMALRDYEPAVVTRYILDVATAFNRFYHECSIFNRQSPVPLPDACQIHGRRCRIRGLR